MLLFEKSANQIKKMFRRMVKISSFFEVLLSRKKRTDAHIHTHRYRIANHIFFIIQTKDTDQCLVNREKEDLWPLCNRQNSRRF